MSQPSRPSPLLGLLFVVAGSAGVLVLLFGTVLLDFRRFVKGEPWDAVPISLPGLTDIGIGAGLLADEGYSKEAAGFYCLPTLCAVSIFCLGAVHLVGRRPRWPVLLFGLTVLFVSYALAIRPLSAAYHRRNERVRWEAAARQPLPDAPTWDQLYFHRVPVQFQRPNARVAAYTPVVELNPSSVALCGVHHGLQHIHDKPAEELLKRVEDELRRRAASSDPAVLAEVVGGLIEWKAAVDPALEGMRFDAVPRLAEIAETCRDRFVLSHLVADIRRHDREDDPECARLVAVWKRRVEGGF